MDIGNIDDASSDDEEEIHHDLAVMKGDGKGEHFPGYCNYCWKYHAGKNVYLPVFCFEGLISEFPKFTYRFPSLRASFSSQVKKCLKPDLFLGCRFSVR